MKDAKAASAQIGHAEVKVAGAIPGGLEDPDRAQRHRTVRAAAIGDDLPIAGELLEPRTQLVERDAARARQIARAVLLLRPHVEQRHLAASDQRKQLVPLGGREGAKLTAQAVQLRKDGFGELTDGAEEERHAVSGETILDVLPLALCSNQARGAHLLQVLRRVGQGDAGGVREHLHASRALPEQIEQLQADGARERLSDAGQLAVMSAGELGCGVLD